jgi:thiol:disulfide interchange protein DsbC
MNRSSRAVAALVLAAGLAAAASPAFADEAAIRKNLAERLPQLPKIDEVRATPIPGLYEIRIGVDVYYTDEAGNHFIDGQLVDTKTRTNLTAERVAKLTAIDFAALPLKDAIVWKQGTGARKMVVFADPNCGYCKKLEHDMLAVKDVTVYTFLIPILGGDSPDKARTIWCAKDNGKVWRDWMIGGSAPVKSMGECDTGAIQRNLAFAGAHKINGTPAIIFEDGSRVPGALEAAAVEKKLAGAKKG